MAAVVGKFVKRGPVSSSVLAERRRCAFTEDEKKKWERKNRLSSHALHCNAGGSFLLQRLRRQTDCLGLCPCVLQDNVPDSVGILSSAWDQLLSVLFLSRSTYVCHCQDSSEPMSVLNSFGKCLAHVERVFEYES